MRKSKKPFILIALALMIVGVVMSVMKNQELSTWPTVQGVVSQIEQPYEGTYKPTFKYESPDHPDEFHKASPECSASFWDFEVGETITIKISPVDP